MGAAGTTKEYTISLPADLARSAEALATQESRTVNELFQEAVRAYSQQRVEAMFAEIAEYAATRNPMSYTEEDIPRLIKEWRAEQDALAASRSNE
jgi:hypothetical protein